ncbi:MAG: hypothetical protein QXD24_03940 [Candidatus Caldarchaeum sp.]
MGAGKPVPKVPRHSRRSSKPAGMGALRTWSGEGTPAAQSSPRTTEAWQGCP